MSTPTRLVPSFADQQRRIAQRRRTDQAVVEQLRAFATLGRGEHPVLGHEFDYLPMIVEVHRMMYLLVRPREPLSLTVKARAQGGGSLPTPLGEWFQQCVRFPVMEIQKAYRWHRLSPYFRLFARHIDSYRAPSVAQGTLVGDPVAAIENLRAEAIEAMRQQARTERTSTTFINDRKSLVEASRGLLGYVRELHRRHPELLVVRVNLAFSDEAGAVAEVPAAAGGGEPARPAVEALVPPAMASPSVSPETPAPGGTGVPTVEPADVKACLNRQLAHMQKKYRYRLGYAWCIEYSLIRGFNIHVLMFFDALEVSQGPAIAAAFGAHWVSQATGGRGVYWNGNLDPELNARRGIHGIGIVRREDPAQRRAFEQAVLCLTKVDRYMRLYVPNTDKPGIGKTYSRGSLPKAPRKPRAGPVTRRRAKQGRSVPPPASPHAPETSAAGSQAGRTFPGSTSALK